MRSRARSPVALVALSILLTALFAACDGREQSKETGSETHFLRDCSVGCGGLDCFCGVCTLTCEGPPTCEALFDAAECVATAARLDGVCGSAGPAAICDVPCSASADCEGLGQGFACVAGHCREGALCARADPTASGVIVMGDVMLELTPFASDLEGLARASGGLAAGSSFRRYAAAADSFLAGDMLSLSVQYQRAQAEGPATLAIMNGGETDVLQEPCGTAPTSDCQALQLAAAAAESLLAQMAADGVRDVVYLYYADPVDRPSVKAGLDVLRPMIQTVCANAALGCRFVDLRPTFEGRYAEYVGTDGLVWSDQGARAIADQVWALLQGECISWDP